MTDSDEPKEHPPSADCAFPDASHADASGSPASIGGDTEASGHPSTLGRRPRKAGQRGAEVKTRCEQGGYQTDSRKKKSRKPRTSHDQYFKNLIVQYPRQALSFFALGAAEVLDDSVIITPIRQEMLMERLGERFFELDVPLEVRWPDGRREAMIFIIEEETTPGRFAIDRLAKYCLEIYGIYRIRAITPVVVFLRDDPGIPLRLDLEGVDKAPVMFFRYVPCILPQYLALEHLDTDNLVEQVLLPTMSWSPQDKVHIVGRAIRSLLRLEKNIDNQLKFEKFIRTYAPLDEEEERQYKETYALESSHMLSIREELERKGERRGRRIGRKEGLAEGREEGIQIGEERGLLSGQRQTVARLLTRRFGPLEAEVEARLNQASKDELDHWADVLLTAGSLEEVFRVQ